MTFNIKIFGIVQGVGFRPFIKNLADNFFILGTVANKGSYVEIFAQTSEIILKNFIDAIKKNAPPRSNILKIDFKHIFFEKIFTNFEIIESEHEIGDIFVSPDIGICEKCAEELFDKNNRRYLHPFINCTNCGPRLTILEKMPYDRERTSMKNFKMCKKCSEEYFDKNSRRFDAQPICCNDCGPKLKLIIKNEELRINDAEIIKKVRKILFEGGIIAIKGIGGFHIACDAKNFESVKRLRKLKNRPEKPFAVMFKNFSAIKRECYVNEKEKNFLESYHKPIILLQKKFPTKIASNVAPEINKIGAMLPYTPLHMLIFDFPDEIENFPEMLIMTSGNISGNPIEICDENLIKNLGKNLDGILTHNREILLRADDSVMEFVGEIPQMVRRSRGFSPLPIYFEPKNEATFQVDFISKKEFSGRLKSILAIGGELKNTFCLAKNNLLYASPYIGDLGNLQSSDILKKSIERMSELLEITPEIVICDKHPRYQSVKIAEEIAKKLEIPLIKIQHHYAHILSNLAENNFNDEVIGVAFDGTGYGDDGTIWGGEFFICDTKNYKRVGHISKFMQAGRDKSARECWRSAISMMKDVEVAKKLNLVDEKSIIGQKFLLENEINCVESTSCGRLFDAISAILGICKVSTYEGESAMKLQSFAENFVGEVEVKNIFSTAELFEKILEKILNGAEKKYLARYFHEGLSEIIAETCEKIKNRHKIKTVALSGGVFQNSLLTSITVKKLNLRGFKILLNKMIPPNDGGLCIGQAAFMNI